LALSLLFLYRRPASTVGHPRKTPRISFFALQHVRNPRPFFFTSPLEEAFEKRYPAPQKSHPQGLATLSAVLAPRSLGNLFQFPTLLGFPLQSFAPLLWSALCLHQAFRSCTFLENRRRLSTGASATFSHSEAVPLFAPRYFTSGRGPCSLGLSGLSGSPFASAR
jgi:hypothetical protein